MQGDHDDREAQLITWAARREVITWTARRRAARRGWQRGGGDHVDGEAEVITLAAARRRSR